MKALNFCSLIFILFLVINSSVWAKRKDVEAKSVFVTGHIGYRGTGTLNIQSARYQHESHSWVHLSQGGHRGLGLAGKHISFSTGARGVGKGIIERMRLTKEGDLEVKNTIRSTGLQVKGTIQAYKVLVNTKKWSDFVFEKNYQLRSLESVENYIREHKHLPEIPSAKEVQANGINVADIQSKLLQKIEELTLYVIDLKKSNDKLLLENQSLRKRLTILESQQK